MMLKMFLNFAEIPNIPNTLRAGNEYKKLVYKFRVDFH